MHRRLFETVGSFDEEYFFAGEMADLCRRASQAGLRCVIDPSAQASHDVARSCEERQTLHAYYVIRNRFLYVRRHDPARQGRLFVLWTLRAAWAAARALVRGRLRSAGAIGLGLMHGWRGRFGARNRGRAP